MKLKLREIFDFYPFTMSDAPADQSDELNQSLANEQYVVMWFLIVSLTIMVFSPKMVAFWMTLAAMFSLGLFFSGSVRMRSLVSIIMLPALLVITGLVAWRASVPEDQFNWVFSKSIFIIFFGLFGTHLAERFNWEKYNFLVLVVGVIMLVTAQYLKFGERDDAGEIVCVAISALEKTCFALKSPGPVTAYGPHDWYEDLLLGVAVILYAVIVPKATRR